MSLCLPDSSWDIMKFLKILQKKSQKNSAYGIVALAIFTVDETS
jgi:hypothetical protein